MGIAVTCVTIAGCYAEGISYTVNSSGTDYFLTLKRCEEEAIATKPDGSPKYVGFKCMGKLLFVTTETRDYYHGKPTGK
jgi:hypothetical protein